MMDEDVAMEDMAVGVRRAATRLVVAIGVVQGEEATGTVVAPGATRVVPGKEEAARANPRPPGRVIGPAQAAARTSMHRGTRASGAACPSSKCRPQSFFQIKICKWSVAKCRAFVKKIKVCLERVPP